MRPLQSLAGPDWAVVMHTRQLIESVRKRTGLIYADELCGSISPISIRVIAKQLGADIIEDDIGEHAQEVGVPGLLGPPVIVVNRYAEPSMRALACRHGLAHLLAGDLDVGDGMEVRFMSSILEWQTFEERSADLFALADVLEAGEVRDLFHQVRQRRLVARAVRARVKAMAPRWPTARVADRARLRLALYEDGSH